MNKFQGSPMKKNTEKHLLSPKDLLEIAAQHAYCAEHLLEQQAEVKITTPPGLRSDALRPITSLIYTAFELTFKALMLHEHKKIHAQAHLLKMIEPHLELALSKELKEILNRMEKIIAYKKGVEYPLFDNREKYLIFCEKALDEFAILQKELPLELHPDYFA